MTARRLAPTRCALILVAALAAVALSGAVAPAQTGPAAAKRITRSGVDGVKLRDTFQDLRNRGLVGRIRHGCELGGPRTRSARLLAPLKGSVDFTLTKPRKVTNITVRGGARARGVGIGARIRRIKAAFPRARVDHSTDATFGITLVKIPRRGGGRLQFGVDTTTKRTTLIGIPFIAFCE
jgi:hypothetical protein